MLLILFKCSPWILSSSRAARKPLSNFSSHPLLLQTPAPHLISALTSLSTGYCAQGPTLTWYNGKNRLLCASTSEHMGLPGESLLSWHWSRPLSGTDIKLLLFEPIFFFIVCIFFFSSFLILINLFIFIQLQLSAFSPLPSTPPQPVPPPSTTSTLPLDFVLVSFIVAPIDPSPHYPLPTPLWLVLQCS